MTAYFIGSKSSPEFLVEVNKTTKNIDIYKPDKMSKNEEFYEKYSLGKLVLSAKYKNIIFIKKPVSYKKHKYVSDIIVQTNEKYLLINNKINILKTT